MNLLVATSNKNKLAELKLHLDKFNIMTLDELPEIKRAAEPAEDARTLEGNAKKKAVVYGTVSNMVTLADDSGLFVEELDFFPGVHSARVTHKGAAADRKLILQNMKGIKNRRAALRTVVCFHIPSNGVLKFYSGMCWGTITENDIGDENTFAYDSIFIPENCTLRRSEMTLEQIAAISHRGKACDAFVKDFENNLFKFFEKKDPDIVL